jgi:DNA-binding LacI/PurR family transcriptional regulator
MTGKSTSIDIAYLAGVSQSTVSPVVVDTLKSNAAAG